VANADDSMCAACQFGKAHQYSHKSQQHGVIGDFHKIPGAGVSADQMEARHPGHMPNTHRMLTNKYYHFCNFWIDHFSRFVCIIMHESKDASETHKSKA